MTNTSTKSSAPKPEAGPSAEIRSGLLVTASVITLLALLFTAGNFQPFASNVDVPVVFTYISGLEKNAPVHFAGHKVGKVTGITFLGGDESKVMVTLNIAKNVKLRKDSQAFIDVMGFMGEKFIEISTGTPAAGALPADQALQGVDPVPMMKIVKEGTELLAEFKKSSESMTAITADLQKIIGKNQDNLNEIFDNLNASSKNLKDMTEDLKLHPWKLLRKTEESKKKKLLLF